MKNIIIAGIISLLTFNLFGQKIIEKELTLPPSNILEVELKLGDVIKISTWDNKNVGFKASIDLNNGLLNDSLQHQFIEGENLVINSKVPKSFKNWMSKRDYNEENENIRFWTGKENFIISEVIYEIKVPKNCLLTLNTINADVEIKNLQQSMNIKTINGFVDASWKENATANFELKTINGEVYSDLELTFLNKKKNPIVGYNLKAKLGKNSSKEVRLQTINGDIFLRKEKDM